MKSKQELDKFIQQRLAAPKPEQSPLIERLRTVAKQRVRTAKRING